MQDAAIALLAFAFPTQYIFSTTLVYYYSFTIFSKSYMDLFELTVFIVIQYIC